MPVMPPASVALYLDALGTAYARAIGTQASGYGLGVRGETWGMYRGFDLAEDVLRDISDDDLQPAADMAGILLSSMRDLDGARQALNFLDPLLVALQSHVRRDQLPGVSDLETWLVYYNAGSGGPWLSLLSPLLTPLFLAWVGRPYSPLVFYRDLPIDGTNPNGLGARTVGSGFVAGATIDPASYAGGFPCVAHTGIVGGGVVTVTGTARKPDGQTQTGRTWTATLPAGNGDVLLAPGGGTPAPADSLILDVSGITLAGGISVGTARVYAAPPTGRSVLPL